MRKTVTTLLALLLSITISTGVYASMPLEERPPEAPKSEQAVHCLAKKYNGDVQRQMMVSDPEASLSGLSSIIGDTGYFQMFGSISDTDTRNFWMDSRILKERFGITKIRLFLNSLGGSGADGIGLADLITSVQKEGFGVEVYATGMVASAAIPVLAACGKRVANEGCMFMVHQAKLFKYLSQESAADLKAQSKMMEILTKKYLSILENRTNLTAAEWLRAMEKTTWFTAEEALRWGLIDEIR